MRKEITIRLSLPIIILIMAVAVSAMEWIEYPVPTLSEAARAAETIFIARVISGESGELAAVRIEKCIKGTATGEVTLIRKYLTPGFNGNADPEYFIFRDGKEYCVFCARNDGYYEPYFRWNTLWAVARVKNGMIDLCRFADERKERWVELEDFFEEVAEANGWD